VSAADPGTFVTVAFFLVFVSTLASYIPARRAAAIEPMKALYYE
jgi:ABC-type lipoprotein release transport system permease subunit